MARDQAIAVLRRVADAIAVDYTTYAAGPLDTVPPEATDNATATVAGCIRRRPASSTSGYPAGPHIPGGLGALAWVV